MKTNIFNTLYDDTIVEMNQRYVDMIDTDKESPYAF